MSGEHEHCPGCGDDMCQCHDVMSRTIATLTAELARLRKVEQAAKALVRTAKAGNQLCPCCFSEFDERHADKSPTCPFLLTEATLAAAVTGKDE